MSLTILGNRLTRCHEDCTLCYPFLLIRIFTRLPGERPDCSGPLYTTRYSCLGDIAMAAYVRKRHLYLLDRRINGTRRSSVVLDLVTSAIHTKLTTVPDMGTPRC